MNAKEQSESSGCRGDFQACANNFMSGVRWYIWYEAPRPAVVPAQAGTHTPRPLLPRSNANRLLLASAGGYGSLLSQGRQRGLHKSPQALAPPSTVSVV